MLEEPSGSQWPVLDTFSALKLNNTVPVQTTAIVQHPPPPRPVAQPPYSTAHGSAFTGCTCVSRNLGYISSFLLWSAMCDTVSMELLSCAWLSLVDIMEAEKYLGLRLM